MTHASLSGDDPDPADVAIDGTDRGSVTPADPTVDETRRRTIPYQPALDGVRALAVLVVLLFHAEVAGFDGGYLGVSVFFTLSGFLITSLLATETEATGGIRLGRFYARRARRLLPASILLVAVVVIAASVTDWFDAVADLRSHVVGSLLQVANWVFLVDGGSYQDLLQEAAGAASPLEHYWSLAIEEQFYWLWPVAFVALWRLGRTRSQRIVVFGALTAVLVVAAPVVAIVWGPDAAYWASPARAAEILLGGFVAVAIIDRRLDPRWRFLAPVMLAALAACVVWFPTSGGPAYAGWLPGVGAASALLLVALQVRSPLRRVLGAPPLVWLGRISYGVYLFHWPIFVVMNEDRVGVDGPLLLIARLATTLAVAQVSYTLYEQPIRRARRLTVRPTLAAAALATTAVVAVAFVVVPGPASDYWEADDGAAEAVALDAGDDEPLVALAPEAGAADGDVGDRGTDGRAGERGAADDVDGTSDPDEATGEASADRATGSDAHGDDAHGDDAHGDDAHGDDAGPNGASGDGLDAVDATDAAGVSTADDGDDAEAPGDGDRTDGVAAGGDPDGDPPTTSEPGVDESPAEGTGTAPSGEDDRSGASPSRSGEVGEPEPGSGDDAGPSTAGAGEAPPGPERQTTPPTSTLPPIPALSRPVRVIVAGDSTAEALGAGVVNWAAFAPDTARAELNIQKGCGFIRGGEYLLDGDWYEVRDACTRWLEDELPRRIAETSPDVVMMMTTSFDVLDHRFDGGDGASPRQMRDTIEADFARVTDEALVNGAGTVVWIKAPLPNPLWFSLGSDQEQPDRHAVLDEVMDEIARQRPGRVHVVDLRDHFRRTGITADRDVRPDGVHMAPGPATDIVAEYLGEQLIRAALDLL